MHPVQIPLSAVHSLQLDRSDPNAPCRKAKPNGTARSTHIQPPLCTGNTLQCYTNSDATGWSSPSSTAGRDHLSAQVPNGLTKGDTIRFAIAFVRIV